MLDHNRTEKKPIINICNLISRLVDAECVYVVQYKKQLHKLQDKCTASLKDNSRYIIECIFKHLQMNFKKTTYMYNKHFSKKILNWKILKSIFEIFNI